MLHLGGVNGSAKGEGEGESSWLDSCHATEVKGRRVSTIINKHRTRVGKRGKEVRER